MSTRKSLYDKNILKDTLKDYSKEVFNSAVNVASAASSFLPLFGVVINLVNEVVKIYETTQYNKKMCGSLLERVIVAECAVKKLLLMRKEYEEKFNDQEFYNAFQKFTNSLKNIKSFMEDLTKYNKANKMLRANSIKERFDSVVEGFNTAMNDLNFNLVIDNELQRRKDFENLKEDIEEIKKLSNFFSENFDKVFYEIQFMNKKNSCDYFKQDPIDSNQLQLQYLTTNRIKGLYKYNEVECKRIDLQERNSKMKQRFKTRLAILEKASQGPNILKFYGLSKFEERDFQVLEWAEFGSLKDFYEKKDIAWRLKIYMARAICRGLAFLNSVGVLHHDIRCENIMLNECLEPKIANFDLARYHQDETSQITNFLEVLPWMAPEKMEEKPYNTRCEIFSFGMLLWELSFEKYPYRGLDEEKIRERVMAGERESINFGAPRDQIEKKIQQGLAKIIKAAWCHDPDQRIYMGNLFAQLERLAENCIEPGFSREIFADGHLDLDGSKNYDINSENSELENVRIVDNIKLRTIMSLEEGEDLHQKINEGESDEKMREEAWKCFSDNADMGNSIAKYWKGYYLWKGYISKDPNKAIQLFKEAADDNVPKAQLRYAIALISEKRNISKQTQEEFIKYLTMAADNENDVALFNLGDLYLNGKFDVQKDPELGIKKLKLAASLGNKMAIATLEKLH